MKLTKEHEKKRARRTLWADDDYIDALYVDDGWVFGIGPWGNAYCERNVFSDWAFVEQPKKPSEKIKARFSGAFIPASALQTPEWYHYVNRLLNVICDYLDEEWEKRRE